MSRWHQIFAKLLIDFLRYRVVSGILVAHRACDSQSLSRNGTYNLSSRGKREIVISSGLVAHFGVKFGVAAALRALSGTNSGCTSDS